MQADRRTRPHPAVPRTPPVLRRVLVVGGTAAALLVAAAPATAAGTTTKASGTTTIKLSSGFRSVLKRSGISLSGVSPARRGATAVKLPLTGATVDASAGSATLNHSGAVRFRRGGRSITLKSFRVAVSSSGAGVTAVIGSTRVRAFEIDASKARVAGTSKRLTLGNLAVTLTPIGASRLNRALGVTRFRRGAALGVAGTSIATPATGTGGGAGSAASATTLRSGTSTLSLTPEAKAGLRASGATVSTLAPATGSGDGPFAFPITGGSLDGAKAFAGSATLGGALQVTFGGATYVLRDPVVDTENRRITAVYEGSRIEVFSLDLGAVRHVTYDGQLVLDGIVVKGATSGALAGSYDGVVGTLRLAAVTD